jgi:hypothetical protein
MEKDFNNLNPLIIFGAERFGHFSGNIVQLSGTKGFLLYTSESELAEQLVLKGNISFFCQYLKKRKP